MFFKGILPAVHLGALPTLERLLLRVDSRVILYLLLACEPHGALRTRPRPLPGVHQHVHLELAGLLTSVWAQGAGKGSFPGVHPLVYPEVCRRFAHDHTPRVGTRVDNHVRSRVNLHLVRGCKHGATLVADVHLRGGVRPNVSLEMARQPERSFTPRVVASVWFLARVHSRVHHELVGFVERHAALGVGAGVRLGAGVHAQVDAQVVHAGEIFLALVAGVHDVEL